MYIEREIIMSKAMRRLSKKKFAIHVLLIFFTKKVIRKHNVSASKRSGKGVYYIENQGEIQFTYLEAERKWGISPRRFRDAIDLLIEVGFIDIACQGMGLKHDKSLYAISDRWRLYGTEDFIEGKKRPKCKRGYGFRKGNRLGKYST